MADENDLRDWKDRDAAHELLEFVEGDECPWPAPLLADRPDGWRPCTPPADWQLDNATDAEKSWLANLVIAAPNTYGNVALAFGFTKSRMQRMVERELKKRKGVPISKGGRPRLVDDESLKVEALFKVFHVVIINRLLRDT